jgi:hypothetical protein
MLTCAAGDTHGALDRFSDDLLAFEADLGGRFAQVLHVGDFGIWPDPARVDRATRDHEGPGDFPTWWAERRTPPRPTLFIEGDHEDFAWLDGLEGDEVLPGLRYLRNGQRAELAGGVVVAACAAATVRRTTSGQRTRSRGLPAATTPATSSTTSRRARGRTCCSSTTRPPNASLPSSARSAASASTASGALGTSSRSHSRPARAPRSWASGRPCR